MDLLESLPHAVLGTLLSCGPIESTSRQPELGRPRRRQALDESGVALQHPAGHIAGIAQEMEAVGNLDGSWRSASRALGVLPAPIPTHDRDTWMLREPVCQRSGRAVRQ
jgi:hypothetical protein